MSPESTVMPTPGVDRVIRFSIGGAEFGFRRPSRADVHDAWRLLTRKLAASGHPDTFNHFDGVNLQWEARLEIGLQPRLRAGQALDLGEQAPAHWLMPIKTPDGQLLGHAIDFVNVDPDEFAAVVAYLDAELKKKAPSLPATSTGSAPAPTSA